VADWTTKEIEDFEQVFQEHGANLDKLAEAVPTHTRYVRTPLSPSSIVSSARLCDSTLTRATPTTGRRWRRS
jgi:hypothetical protein